MNPDNARIPRITAAAGTELADAYSYGTLVGPRVTLIAPVQKKFKTHRAVAFTRHGWIRLSPIVQYSSLLPPVGVCHCPIFLTAASRRSLDRVSVPVWGTNLSVPLDIVASVGRYPTD